METLHIEQELILAAEPQRAFEALTLQVDAWWAHRFDPLHSTVRLEPHAGGRFYEEFEQKQGSALYATIMHIESGKKVHLMGPMGMSGPAIGFISFDLEPDARGTRLKLSHQVTGAVDEAVREGYTTGWVELLEHHFKRLVEEGKGVRKA